MQDFKRSTIYQIYPRSFQDTNKDGVGDLNGIIQRLNYLEKLGVDYLWLTPFFKSPQNDNGYDVADYRSIDPLYGSMKDFEELTRQAEKHGIGIMLDMVFNHTSTQHWWFQKSLEGDPVYKDYYIWKDPPKDGGLPTNWESKFGGPVWEYVPERGQYYLHLFDKTQADLNWENPRVREELKDILRFWTQKGVKGFRFDVVNLISKPAKLENDDIGDGRRLYTDGPKVHEYLQELCTEINQEGLITVGEMSSTSIDQCVQYSNPDNQELSMCFNFHHLKVDYKDQQKWSLKPPDFNALKSLLYEWQMGMEQGNGWNALFWSNHDQPRILSRFGDAEEYPEESAKMLAAMLYLTRGTPYVFQGEEIGMTNAGFTDIKQYVDVESVNYYHILQEQGHTQAETLHILRQRSRDNSRTPMQWDDSSNAGFTDGTPWLDINTNYKQVNAEKVLQTPDSIFAWYQKLIQMRKELDVVAYGNFLPLLEDHDSVFAYERAWNDTSLVVIANFFGQETEVELKPPYWAAYECILSNYDSRAATEKMRLKPYETLVFLK